MELNNWSERFSVNLPAIDNDHQRMIQLIHCVYESIEVGHNRQILLPLIKAFSDCVDQHLLREEKFLSMKKYSYTNIQKQQHYLFLEKINEFKEQFDKDNRQIALKMLPVLN